MPKFVGFWWFWTDMRYSFMLPIGCFFTDPAFLFKSTSTYCVPDEPNQVYKFFKAFQLKPNRLCDSKILDTGCKVHTTESPRSILLIFFLSFFAHISVAGRSQKAELKKSWFWSAFNKPKPARTPLVCNPRYIVRCLNSQISKKILQFWWSFDFNLFIFSWVKQMKKWSALKSE